MSFYSMVLIIAFVILLISLIFVGILLQNQDANKEFPAQANYCPDGWGVDSSGNCAPATGNLPKPSTDGGSVTSTDYTTGGIFTAVAGSGKYKPVEGVSLCDKREWAISKGVSWDGVSNFNNCV